MKLEEYLKLTNLSNIKFAAKMNDRVLRKKYNLPLMPKFNSTSVGLWLAKKRTPSLDRIKIMEILTYGKITALDFLVD